MTFEHMELRHLPTGLLCGVATVLEINDDWKKVMSLIPINHQSEEFAAKYTKDQIKQIEDHARATNKKCAEVLFEEWGSSGRIRPTLKTLQKVVLNAEILRAADDIAALLGEAKAKRPTTGPGAPIVVDTTERIRIEKENNVHSIGCSTNLSVESEGLSKSTLSCDLPNISAFKKLGAKTKSENDLTKYSQQLKKDYDSKFKPDFRNKMSEISNSSDSNEAINQETFPEIEVNPEISNNPELKIFPYQELARITDKFNKSNEGPTNSKSRIIGIGGFSEVYLGYLHNYGQVAVKKPIPNSDYKRTPEIFNNNFNSEILFLSLFKHTNIVKIIGYSIDGPSPCIVCEYIEGGTLEKKLEEKTLNEKERINIMIGIAEALKYLHSDNTDNITRSALAETGSRTRQNFVHGDLKTANILLTKDYVPKLCDFAAGKQYDLTRKVSILMGTKSYQAPEQSDGTVTQETDIYHYGRILLELLTGLKSIVVIEFGQENLKEYVEYNKINNCLDRTIDRWTKAMEIYNLAKSCLNHNRKQRPSATKICRTLHIIGKSLNMG